MRVVVVQRYVPQYRRRFFELLREGLRREGVTLDLVYSDTLGDDDAKGDAVVLPWATAVRITELGFGGRRAYWQHCLRRLRNADLIVVEQASRPLLNHLLFLGQLCGFTRVALWGHGETSATEPLRRLAPRARRFMSRCAHWWFAYNRRSVAGVRTLGYPAERITPVQNAIDTRSLEHCAGLVSEQDLDRHREELGLVGHNVCLFVGGMYERKRLPYLLSACGRIRREIPDFQMLFLGAGPCAPFVAAAAESNPWIHYLGPRFDEEKVVCFLLAQLVLMPAGVGLGLLDSFALRKPLVTVEDGDHGPEIDYAEPGKNALVLPGLPSPDDYALGVVTVLRDAELLARLRAGCEEAATQYSAENMATRFTQGVLEALEAPAFGAPHGARRGRSHQ